MIRAVKLSLNFASQKKRGKINAILERQRSCVNRFIERVWKEGGALDQATMEAVPDARLSSRYRSLALNQALGMIAAAIAAAKVTKKKVGMPVLKGSCKLGNNVAQIKDGDGLFSYWIKLSTLSRGNPIMVPLKGTRVLDKWLAFPGAKLLKSCAITEKYVYLYVDVPKPEKVTSKVIAVDVGLNKMLVDSDGKTYGTGFKALCQKVARRTPGSKGKHRARTERTCYINNVINQIPWREISTIIVENLKRLKAGKKRTRQFRRAMAPWTYAYVLERIRQKAEENGVLLKQVCPSYTSQTCPACKHRAKSNRTGEKFKCGNCGYAEDADFVGALNLLFRGGGEFRVPRTLFSLTGEVNLTHTGHCSI